MYLNYESADKPVTMYINSTGSTIKNNTRYIGESKVGLETDAFAIADCMKYIKPDVATIVMGQAASMGSLLAQAGAPGKRSLLPKSRTMIHQPSGGARGMASDIEIQYREIERMKERKRER